MRRSLKGLLVVIMLVMSMMMTACGDSAGQTAGKEQTTGKEQTAGKEQAAGKEQSAGKEQNAGKEQTMDNEQPEGSQMPGEAMDANATEDSALGELAEELTEEDYLGVCYVITNPGEDNELASDAQITVIHNDYDGELVQIDCSSFAGSGARIIAPFPLVSGEYPIYGSDEYYDMPVEISVGDRDISIYLTRSDDIDGDGVADYVKSETPIVFDKKYDSDVQGLLRTERDIQSGVQNYNVEYKLVAYSLESEGIIYYYDYNGGTYSYIDGMMTFGGDGRGDDFRSFFMVAMHMDSYNSPNKEDSVSYWFNCFARPGDEVYGMRPYNDPSGVLENVTAYDAFGELDPYVLISYDLTMNYDYNNPVLIDNGNGIRYYFKRTSGKIYW